MEPRVLQHYQRDSAYLSFRGAAFICLSASLRGAAGPLAAPLSGVIVHRARDTIAGGISLTLETPRFFRDSGKCLPRSLGRSSEYRH
jgi:hypothetical protein